MKRLLAILLFALPAFGQDGPAYAAFINQGSGWIPWAAPLGSGNLAYSPLPIHLYCSSDGVTWTPCNPSSGGSGVTSIAWSLPSYMAASPTTLSAAGTQTFSFNSQTANYFFAAPNGSTGAPTFRAIVAADIPTLNQSTTGSAGNLSGTQTANYFYAAPNGTTGAGAWRAILAADIPTLNQSTTGNAATATGINGNGSANQIWAMNSGATAQLWESIATALGYTPANCTPGTTGTDCLQLASGLVPTGNLPGYVADTTITVGASVAFTANTCSSATGSAGTASTVSMTGLATSMTATFMPTSDVHAVTGWSPGTSGQLYFSSWPSASGTLSYYVCNPTSSSITTGSSVTWNVSAR